MFYRVENGFVLVTWTPLREIQGGVRGGWVTSDDSGATYATVGGPGGGQVSKFWQESGRKCVIFFSFYRVDKALILVTWMPLRAIQGGLRGGWVMSDDSGATYATLDFSEWRPSHQDKSNFHTIKHRENNQGLRHFLGYFL